MRFFTRILLELLIAATVLCVADWVVFRTRGGPLNSVNVELYLKTPLKGQKTQYDFLGLQPTNCSRSLFPQYGTGQWNAPCWWLQRHKQRWQ